MKRDERTGLVLLIAFVVVCGVFLASTTDSGRGISNIFSNLIVDSEYAPSPVVEAQLAVLRQPLSTDWLIGFTAVIAGIVTVCAIIAFRIAKKRIPHSWCVLLIIIGAAAVLLILASSQIQAQLGAIPRPVPPLSSGTYDGLAAEIGLLQFFGLLGGLMIVIGAGLLGWSLIRQRRRA